MIKPLPHRELLCALFAYDPLTGELRWRLRPREMFKSDRDCKIWNTRFAGKVAGCDAGNYRFIVVLNSRYLAHRLIWKMVYGEPVPGLIDHKDTDGVSNRLANLRPATKAENMANSRKPKNNSTGIKGVRVSGRRLPFQAGINHHGKFHFLGRFATLDEAAEARRNAAEKLQGAFARHG